MNSRIKEYLSALEANLVGCPERKKVLDEVRDHLISSCASYEARGLDGAEAAQSAISDFGDVGPFADDMKAEHSGLATQNSSVRFLSIVFGGFAGALMTSFGLIDTSGGELAVAGGNEWTPVVTGTGIILGAFLLSLQPIRRRLSIPVGAVVGLTLAILFRDQIQLGPIGGFDPVPLSEFAPYDPPPDGLIIALMLASPFIGAVIGHGVGAILRSAWSSYPARKLRSQVTD
ncbi:MAG: permease prefix domain 1-containing protein [Actinomycetota bacterium]